jgi:hypothetical protein
MFCTKAVHDTRNCALCFATQADIARARKSWSEIATALSFLFLLPFANLHLLTYDRWYLQHGVLLGREPLD